MLACPATQHAYLLPLLAALLTACSPQPPSGISDAAIRGWQAFRIHCSACHNLEHPSQPGLQGPPIANSSLELLTARVVDGKYPAGYQPKQDTRLMMPIPAAKKDLPDLFAYLAEVR